jgi:hypothetical protein
MIRFYNFPQRSPQWHIYRKDRWTGSTAIDLLKGTKTPPEGNPDYDNKYMQRGRILEPLAIEAYEHKTGNVVKHYGFITNSKYKHAGYSPDGIVGDTIIEVKCVNTEKHMIIGESMIIPMEWIAQTHLGVVITELQKIKLILYNPDAETTLFIIDIEVRPKIIENIIEKLDETIPKRKPSQLRAAKRYVEKHPDRVRESNFKRYEKAKKAQTQASRNKESN